MHQNIIDIADLDVIFLTYDEPKKEENWLTIKNMIPWARRVDGVVGSDAAHKAAAEESETERFILIDGDNIPDQDFFNLQLDFTGKSDTFRNSQFRWKAKNAINGLRYGNGGISSWTKTYVRNMKTHENQDSGDVSRLVDFCMSHSEDYHSMHDCYSTTYPNQSEFQAWRAGFREGVKMCLDQGRKPTVDEFKTIVASRNLDNLTIWHNVGLDATNGEWAIYGARLGTHMTMLTDWDHTKVQWFPVLQELWEAHKDIDVLTAIHDLGIMLEDKLGLPDALMSVEQSRFFKRHYKTDYRNRGPLVTEMEVIRQIEGW